MTSLQSLGRVQRGLDTRRPGIAVGCAAPRKTLKGIYVDCIAHDAPALAVAAQTFSAKRILFGSDWPFPMGLQEPQRQLADFGRPLQQTIFRVRRRAGSFGASLLSRMPSTVSPQGDAPGSGIARVLRRCVNSDRERPPPDSHPFTRSGASCRYEGESAGVKKRGFSGRPLRRCATQIFDHATAGATEYS
ncbi:MAG: hypothetical protein EHM67_05055 [Hyphomicrobiaceae bacterium]|nr:MAG: hypothetical protein EHM67_05055 [Hyphomicrobiaceae bacterium]